MKKLIILSAAAALLLAASCGTTGGTRATSAAGKAVQALTMSDAQINGYVKQFVDESDKTNTVAPANSPYVTRLNKITKNISGTGDINFKVYITKDVNAFACADGSIRVYSGLMDIMSDDEVLGVLGHEIGHYECKHTKEAFKNSLYTSAIRDIIASTGNVAAALSDSALGDIGESFLSARYSQKQEYEADNYGYDFLKSHNVNPWAMAIAFEKLKAMEASAGVKTTGMQQLFSTHPDLDARIKNMSARATADGFKRPAASK